MSLPFDAPTLAAINTAISRSIGRPYRLRSVRQASGGSMHRAYLVSDGALALFLKLGRAEHAAAFDAEADGLQALRDAGARAPEPLGHGAVGEHAYIVMEHLDLRPARDGDFTALAAMLADLHDTSGPRYGWTQSNFLGPTRQINQQTASWPAFWRDVRLAPLIARVAGEPGNAEIAELGDQLLDALPQLLAGHRPVPSLVHGDLWSGNSGFLASGTPVVFDPAVHFGDRETDIAMTELFGGFPDAFYRAYAERAPLDDGYAERRPLYQLYHLLNHLAIFGAGYRAQVLGCMRRVLDA